MHKEDNYYIELAELVHKAVIEWDPYALIKNGAPKDEHDALEQRFLSRLINGHSNEAIELNVIKNLDSYGVIFTDLTQSQQTQLSFEINKIIIDLKKHT